MNIKVKALIELVSTVNLPGRNEHFSVEKALNANHPIIESCSVPFQTQFSKIIEAPHKDFALDHFRIHANPHESIMCKVGFFKRPAVCISEVFTYFEWYDNRLSSVRDLAGKIFHVLDERGGSHSLYSRRHEKGWGISTFPPGFVDSWEAYPFDVLMKR